MKQSGNICQICSTASVLYSEDSFMETKVYHCQGCDYYYNDLTGVSDVAKYYEDSYWKNVRKKKSRGLKFLKSLSSVYRVFNFMPIELRSMFKLVNDKQSIRKGINFLEVGAGTGKNLYYLKRKGINVHAVEPDHVNADKLNNDLGKTTCHVGSYEGSIFGKKFHQIYLRHVFEHFEDIQGVIEKFKKDLAYDGMITLNVPNCKNQYILNHSVVNHPHTFHYSKKCFIRLFESYDFQVIHCDTYNHLSKGVKASFREVFGLSNLVKADEKDAEFLICHLKLKHKEEELS